MSSRHEERQCPHVELVRLRDKYERMLTLRALHARSRSDPSFTEPDPRPEMAALAREFPGVLREIDELPIDLIRGRIDALAAAADDPSSTERWMIAQVEFHRLARGALVAKRWLAGTKDITATIETRFASAVEDLPRPQDARAWRGHLAAIAAPPRGRLMDLVHARVAAHLGVTEDEERRLVFGISRRDRARRDAR